MAIAMAYRLNSGVRTIKKLGDELGGIGGAAVRNTYVHVEEQLKRDRGLAARARNIHARLVSKE